ncbi:MAG TPA: maltotransferase domain-containing protein [Gaiellaceae bacterium]|nr:maltotransferase domain-containing protein [Gaiellaceae bacterium]
MPVPRTPHPRIQIQAVEPVVDCGRYAVKRTVGEDVEVYATLFTDGHDTLAGVVRVQAPGVTRWREQPLEPLGNDRFAGRFTVDAAGRWQFAVAAWAARAEGPGERVGEVSSPTLAVDVDRELARFGSWYELFPRSFGGFAGVAEALPELARLGFDVVYLPPIHPIGQSNRKGRNNAATAGPDDVGSPWAIGSAAGGHDAIDPELGSWDDFAALVAAARSAGIELALDFAVQCSPDHPWLTEHPEWFNRRPDGTLKYAENPPKRYQDIYNLNFESADWRGLWQALLDVVVGWVERGITVFRVDNPHTKPVPFWEWLIAEVRREHPEVVFLAEAFTRPSMMTTLAKVGFAQSYTYFTWRNTKAELVDFIEELRAWSPFYRPNAFVNTPDILHEYLQRGGPPAFEARLVLAATLSPAYGIYSGFESYENRAVAPGSEEYLDSEKYEVKRRTLDGPLLPLIGRLNEIRRAEPALQRLENVRWLETDNEQLLGYAKDDVICVVNLDPLGEREGACVIPVALGLPPAFEVRDLLGGGAFTWRAGRNYVKLGPGKAHLVKVILP